MILAPSQPTLFMFEEAAPRSPSMPHNPSCSHPLWECSIQSSPLGLQILTWGLQGGSLAVGQSPDSFRAIESRVFGGTLKVILICGIPRGGTTATEKFIFERLGFDGNFNQPGLLAKDHQGDVTRVEAIWDRILAKVKFLESARHFDITTPITLVVKETLNCVVGPVECALLRKVAHATIVVVRDPWLQLESRLNCILMRVDDGALKFFGIDPDTIDPATCTIDGDPLFVPGTDFTHLDHRDGAPSPWLQHRLFMKKTRDFSSLGPGFARLSSLHPLFEVPQCQQHVWSEYALRNPGTITFDDIKSAVGTPSSSFGKLSDILIQAFLEWDIGWAPLHNFLDLIHGEPEAGSAPVPLYIVDFHDLSSAPDAAVQVIQGVLDCATTMSRMGQYAPTFLSSAIRLAVRTWSAVPRGVVLLRSSCSCGFVRLMLSVRFGTGMTSTCAPPENHGMNGTSSHATGMYWLSTWGSRQSFDRRAEARSHKATFQSV
mmetsp:Transcript_32542/g.98107  ORF Transcript_32542/g.98107 Transcript_32542/m.98107 type:complete len:488 (-) Transcript_32542:475-1938(-)